MLVVAKPQFSYFPENLKCFFVHGRARACTTAARKYAQ